MRLISRSGDGYVQAILPFLIWYMIPVNGFEFFKLCCAGFMAERLCYWLLKNLLKRERPPSVVPDFKSIICASDKFSFPSGHTMASFLIVGLYNFYFDTFLISLYIWATLVALSRVVLGVHFPTDTVAGAILGTAIAYWVIIL